MRAGIDYDSEAAWALWDFLFGVLFLNVLLWRLGGVPESNWSLSMMIAGTVFVNALLWRLSGDFHNEWPLWVLVLGAVLLNAVLERTSGKGPCRDEAPCRQGENVVLSYDSSLREEVDFDEPLQGRGVLRETGRRGFDDYVARLNERSEVTAADADFSVLNRADKNNAFRVGEAAKPLSPRSGKVDCQRLAQTGEPPKHGFNNPAHPPRAPPSQ